MGTLARLLVVVVAVALGALFALGCVVAALFEVQGFGDRDGDPSRGYLAALALGFSACVVVPAVLWRRLLGGGPGWLAAAAIAIAGVLLILGLSF
jgi:hypothetical protein